MIIVLCLLVVILILPGLQTINRHIYVKLNLLFRAFVCSASGDRWSAVPVGGQAMPGAAHGTLDEGAPLQAAAVTGTL